MTAVPAAARGRRDATGRGRAGPPVQGAAHRRLLALVGVALVLLVLVRGFVVQSFYLPSASMQPALEPGDRIVVVKVGAAAALRRGDVVVFDGTRVFASRTEGESAAGGIVGRVLGSVASLLSVDTGESDYVKRVVGVAGDHVVCCDEDGAMLVNGVRLDEPYLHPGDAPSDVAFDVVVPPRRLWVMGDHRSQSVDSRAHLGDPGGGLVRLDDVVGRAAAVYWPPGRAQGLTAPDQLRGIPAPTGQAGR